MNLLLSHLSLLSLIFSFFDLTFFSSAPAETHENRQRHAREHAIEPRQKPANYARRGKLIKCVKDASKAARERLGLRAEVSLRPLRSSGGGGGGCRLSYLGVFILTRSDLTHVAKSVFKRRLSEVYLLKRWWKR